MTRLGLALLLTLVLACDARRVDLALAMGNIKTEEQSHALSNVESRAGAVSSQSTENQTSSTRPKRYIGTRSFVAEGTPGGNSDGFYTGGTFDALYSNGIYPQSDIFYFQEEAPFEVGDEVWCRDSEYDEWEKGTISELEPEMEVQEYGTDRVWINTPKLVERVTKKELGFWVLSIRGTGPIARSNTFMPRNPIVFAPESLEWFQYDGQTVGGKTDMVVRKPTEEDFKKVETPTANTKIVIKGTPGGKADGEYIGSSIAPYFARGGPEASDAAHLFWAGQMQWPDDPKNRQNGRWHTWPQAWYITSGTELLMKSETAGEVTSSLSSLKWYWSQHAGNDLYKSFDKTNGEPTGAQKVDGLSMSVTRM